MDRIGPVRIDERRREALSRLQGNGIEQPEEPQLYRGEPLISGVPKRLVGKRVTNYEGNSAEVTKAVEAFMTGASVTLFGACSSGKSHLAVGLMAIWADQIRQLRLPYDRSRRFAHFLIAPEYYLELKREFDQRLNPWDKSILDGYSQAYDLLIIDDIGTEQMSEWKRESLYLLIDRRYREMKQTILTTNLSPAQLAEKIDDRIVDRLAEMGPMIELKLDGQKSFRQKIQASQWGQL